MRLAATTLFAVIVVLAVSASAQVPTTLNDFTLPGSQPGQSGNLEHPEKCDNCHGGYDTAVEPAFNWRGSMMAQAMRDPFFMACMAVSNQDAPDVGDLCIRCHSPAGWLEGRSVPTDGSALNNNDMEGVQCDFCHKFVAPTELGVNPYAGDPDYTSDTYPMDQTYLGTLLQIPSTSANGMYIVDGANAKRGPFVDAAARHQMAYSPFHRDAGLCGTCHDVSNPVYTRNPDDTYSPNDFDTPPPDDDPYAQFPVERTFSEWKMSEYASTGVHAPQFAGNKADGIVSTCQDCHMQDVSGVGCNKRGAPTRPDLPLHDLTGGNTVVPVWVAALYPEAINQAALDAGIARATAMLQKAATLTLDVQPQGDGYVANVRVTNETGHKLPSGYPEGRRIWLNVQVLGTSGAVIYESGAYDFGSGVLTHDADAKIYEIKPGVDEVISGVTGIPEGPSFHFVLNNKIFSDNRIPPRGFTNANFEQIQSPPVAYTYADGQYWDDTQYTFGSDAAQVTVTLYYQTTSKEYIEFLESENVTNDWGTIIYDLWFNNGKSAPVAMATATEVLQAVVDNDPPTAPANLAASAASWDKIDLDWDAATDNIGVAGYYVYRDGAQVADVTGLSYRDTGLLQQTTYSYYVEAYDAAGNVSAASNTASATTKKKKGGGGKPPQGVSGAPALLDVYAHPSVVSTSTRIAFALPEAGDVTVEVYNVKGQLIATPVSGWHSQGVHSETWSSKGLPSGVYFLRLNFKAEQVVHKITVVR
jgi:hypothetical protein